MTPNLKALGLALVAVLAMSAMAASAAQAEKPAQLTAESSPATLDGTQIGEQVFNRSGRTWKCAVANFHAEASNGATTITVTPTYSNCTSSLGPVTVTMNGCDYLFTLTADIVGGNHTYTTVTDIVCPAGKHIELDTYTSAANHAAGKKVCTYTIFAQKGLKTIDLTNEPAGGATPKDWIKADINVAGITSEKEVGDSVLLCGPQHTATATLTGEAELKGTNAATGEKTGITVSTD